MLMRLAEAFPDAVAKLTMQYRMNESICQLSNIIGEKRGIQAVLIVDVATTHSSIPCFNIDKSTISLQGATDMWQ